MNKNAEQHIEKKRKKKQNEKINQIRMRKTNIKCEIKIRKNIVKPKSDTQIVLNQINCVTVVQCRTNVDRTENYIDAPHHKQSQQDKRVMLCMAIGECEASIHHPALACICNHFISSISEQNSTSGREFSKISESFASYGIVFACHTLSIAI